MEKNYKIFIASCKKMLEKEREILSNTIKNNGHIPITMERDFLGSNSERSLNIDKKEIEGLEGLINVKIA